MQTRILSRFALCFLLALTPALLSRGPAHAADWGAKCTTPNTSADLVVAMRNAPPFIASDAIRGQRGFAFDLWTSIEKELREDGLIHTTTFVDCPLSAQLAGLADGTVDVVISPLTITADRLTRFDFSHQYLSSGTTIAQRSTAAIDFGYAASILGETLGHKGVPRAILIFLAVNAVLACLLAWVLRTRPDYEQIGREPLPIRAMRYMLEAVIRTMGIRGMGDGLRGTASTTLDVFAAIVGAILSAIVFGMLTTALVGSIGGTRAVALTELPNMRVATLEGSTSELFLNSLAKEHPPEQEPKAEEKTIRLALPAGRNRAPHHPHATASAARSHCVAANTSSEADLCIGYGTWTDAMDALSDGRVDAVFGDWAQLSYLSRLVEYGGGLEVQGTTFWNEPYGWGISRNVPTELRAAIDRALVRRLRSPEWRFLVQEYMGDGAISPS
ncbi:MAG: transporter substrate-binding domain-containing protein [Pseudomonadota bacterium]